MRYKYGSIDFIMIFFFYKVDKNFEGIIWGKWKVNIRVGFKW